MMYSIYKITNQINQKVYIGMTYFSIEKRFQEHKADSNKLYLQNRPLYAAMRKYGTENFSIELLEKTDMPEEREMHYISSYKSYVGFSDTNGYNATLGGEGRRVVSISDYDILKSYYINKTIQKVSSELNLDIATIRKILRLYDISTENNYKNSIKQFQVFNVYKIKDNVIIDTYGSVAEAARDLISKNISKATENSTRVSIGRAISKKRKSYLGFRWENEKTILQNEELV